MDVDAQLTLVRKEAMNFHNFQQRAVRAVFSTMLTQIELIGISVFALLLLSKVDGLTEFEFEMKAFLCLVRDQFSETLRAAILRSIVNYMAALLLTTDFLCKFLITNYKYSCGMQPYEAAQSLDRRTKQAYEIFQSSLRQLACFSSNEDDIKALYARIDPSAGIVCRLIGQRVKMVLESSDPTHKPAVVIIGDESRESASDLLSGLMSGLLID
jgi:hypothetical protein